MRITYDEGISKVFEDEGGYTNEATDPGGPTNWGITIHDSRQYWKLNATAEDVKDMPKSVAEEIYAKHYAIPVCYDALPAGVDYAVLDYAINSGISRSVKTLQEIVGVTQDGVMGEKTIMATCQKDPVLVINKIYSQRLAFLQSLHTWSTYGHGWGRRCQEGQKLALSLHEKYKQTTPAPQVVQPTSIWITILNFILNFFGKGK